MTKNKERKLVNFAEELALTFENNKDVSMRDLYDFLQSKQNESKDSINADSRYLVGVLPTLFQDTELFANSSEIIDFAINILGIQVSKVAKRSKTEYIGYIVCEVANRKDKNLDILVDALECIMTNEQKMQSVRKAKHEANFSWNDTIAKLGVLNG